METVVMGLVTAIIPTMAIFFMQREVKRRDEAREKKAEAARADRREKDREYMQYNHTLLKMTNASIALGEANAIALKHGRCNGETEKALNYAQEVKHEQKDFLHEQGIENIFKK